MHARNWAGVVGLVVLWMAVASGGAEQDEAGGPLATFLADGGSSTEAARREALEALPLERMAEPQRRAVEACLRATTLYRHLPTKTFACDGELLAFAVRKPETIVDIWRLLGISRLSLDPAGPQQWRLDDGYGTIGSLRLVHAERRGTAGMLVFHGRGAYTGPLAPKPLSGSCVVLVRHAPAAAAVDGRARQTIAVDAFLDMDGRGLEIVTRTLQPLIVRSAAANLHEICLFMTSLSAAAESNPEGVIRLIGRLPRTEPADKQTLAGITRAVGRGAVQPAVGAQQEELSTELAARWLPPR
jgi:hypothetical protein